MHFEGSTDASVSVLIGRSGSGKTTLAKMIAGLVDADHGFVQTGNTVFLDTARKVNVPCRERSVGYVFQEHRLFAHLTVRENIEFPQRFGKRKASMAFDDVAHLLGLTHLLERRPDTLSGGESQRVAIARALMAAEHILIMDEPLSSLDPKTKDEVLDYIALIPQKTKIPVLYITHSPQEAKRLTDDAFLISDGCVAGHGSLDELLKHPLYR